MAPPFTAGTALGPEDVHITEASGLAASRVHPGILYTHNDHGDGPHIYAINASDASLVATLTIGSGAQHIDWEDIAVGPCSQGGKSCIYIGDIGDISSRRGNAFDIYRVVEPADLIDGGVLAVDSKASFTYVILLSLM